MDFIQARHYTPGRIERIRLLVVHDMETPEDTHEAENVARWFAGSSAPQASAHYCIDPDSVVGSVHEHDTAWHAPGANADGIGFELAGRAAQTRREWGDAASRAILDHAARIMAAAASRHSIRIRRLDDAALADGRTSGIVGHRDVSRVFRLSDHEDPGTGFDYGSFVDRVAFYRSKIGGEPAPAKPADVVPVGTAPEWPFGADDYLGTARPDRHCHSGIRGGEDAKAVHRWQRRMSARGWTIRVDGVFGERSARVAAAFAHEHKLGSGETVPRRAWRAAWLEPIK